MELIALLFIPIAFCIWMGIKHFRVFHASDMIALMLMCSAVIGVAYLLAILVESTSVEYRGSIVESVEYYEPWDEWVRKRCTRTVKRSDGSTSTKSYDCSYRRYHSEEYYIINDKSHKVSIDKQNYNDIVEIWGSKPEFNDMNRRFYRQDGDMYKHHFDWDMRKAVTMTSTHRYENRVKNSSSLYNFVDINKDEISAYGLYESYPTLYHSYKQDCILASHSIPDSVRRYVNHLNGKYGAKHQIRVYFVFFYNQPVEAHFKQQSLWKGGNKNEVVITMSLDSSNKLQWVNVFSWSDVPTYETLVKNKIQTYINKPVNLIEVVDYMAENIHIFKRKEFKDFNYLYTPIHPLVTCLAGMVILFVCYLHCNNVINKHN